ncbi:MAG: hypothetical protein F6K58_25210 [Symploca sp. SIO2E9]|nr:hypothetical protein [Symploca sp. SIO2E9]
MVGSNQFSINPQESFRRSLKKLGKKNYSKTFLDEVERILEELIDNPYPSNSRFEPLPKNTKLPNGVTFHKIRMTISRGASGQIRIMYLVDEINFKIILLYIYNKNQFPKRPLDKDIATWIREAT